MIQKKGRTLGITVDDLLESPRFKLALENYESDPMFMKAILIELGMECLKVGKNTIIKAYATHSSFDQFEMKPFLSNITDFTSFNIWWKLSKLEQQFYIADPKHKLTKRERKVLFEKIRKEFMEYDGGGK